MSDPKINGNGHVNLPTGVGPKEGVSVGPKNTAHNHPGGPRDIEPGGPQGKALGLRNEGPGVNGRGNAYGHHRHDGNGVEVGRKDSEAPARFLENESRAQQIRNRVEGNQPRSERFGDDGPGRGRVNDGVRFRGDDGGHGHHHDEGIRFRSYVGDDRSSVNGNSWRTRSPLITNAAQHVESATRAVASLVNGRALGHSAGRLLDAAVNSAASRLDGVTHGHGHEHSSRDVLASALGRDAFAGSDKAGEKVFKLLDHTLRHVDHELKHLSQDLKRAGHDAPRLNEDLAFASRLHGDDGRAHGANARAAEHLAREIVEELSSALQLGRHLNQLEKTGGAVVRQAEAAIARALYGAGAVTEGSINRPAPAFGPQFVADSRPTPQEVLRDMRAGVFVPVQERYSPFPLTGRARVAAEIMELMRTLDAVEGALQRAATAADAAAQKLMSDSAVALLLRAKLGGVVGENVLDELVALLTPSLPGRAARALIPAHVAAMNGLLTDADGRALLARDGTPLKLERLLWLSTAGGLLGSAFNSESFSARLSPSLLYGFDAIYSVMGFDGRTLAAPHFVAVQAAANESEAESLFGQEPLTAGWARELIERLKDSAVVEHNLLGETLEEALADGRFHVALLSVEVEEGEPVPDSSAVKRLLPGASAAFA